MVRLVEITPENWLEAASLQLAPAQQEFCAKPIGILARGYVYRRDRARVIGIEHEGSLAGLMMVRDLNEEPVCYELQQFLVDERFQNRGIGTQALKLLLEQLALERRYDCVEVCVHRKDAAALCVYEKCGFADTGYIDPDLPEFLNLRFAF